MPVSFLDCFVLLAGFALLNVYMKKRRNPSGLPLPPGPTPLPLIGNIFDIPKRVPWETYTQWAYRYGDILSLRVFGETVVIINSPRIARDLVEKRAAIYSDRPVVHAYEVMKLDFNLVMAKYTSDKWKIGRKLADHSLRQSAAMVYRPMQIRRVRQFLKKISRRDDIWEDLKHMTAGIVMSLTYGYNIAESNDTFVENVENVLQRASSALLPGTTLVNIFPSLKYLPAWLPGMSFKRDALSHLGEMKLVVEGPFDFTKGEIIKGVAQPSIISESMDSFSDKELSEEEERVLKEVAATLYIAGTDSTASTLAFFILALIRHPEVQKHAQNELDTVVGRDRLPEFEDRNQLPYIQAICQELMRWRMITPLGVLHTTSEDDIYEGFFIPKGSQIVINSWSMLHDPEAYPDPEVFRPERFLASNGAFIEDPLVTSVYGWGRRICPGRFLANATIWATAASILSAFDVGKAKDADGREIPVEGLYTDQGVVCSPLPFKCSIMPRDARAERLVAATEDTN